MPATGGSGHRPLDPTGHEPASLLRRAREQDAELVPAEPGHEIRFPHLAADRLGRGTDQRIPDPRARARRSPA